MVNEKQPRGATGHVGACRQCWAVKERALILEGEVAEVVVFFSLAVALRVCGVFLSWRVRGPCLAALGVGMYLVAVTGLL